jgi:hypothetical protein
LYLNETEEERSERTLLQELASPKNVAITQEGELISSDQLFMTLATIKAATGNFSDTNKLGQGGFGTVYKVTYMDYLYFNIFILTWLRPRLRLSS